MAKLIHRNVSETLYKKGNQILREIIEIMNGAISIYFFIFKWLGAFFLR